MLLIEDQAVYDKCHAENGCRCYEVDLGKHGNKHCRKDNNDASDEHCIEGLIFLPLCFESLVLKDLGLISSVGKFILEFLYLIPLLDQSVDLFGIGNLLAESLGLILESLSLGGSKIVSSEFLLVFSELGSIFNPLFSGCFIGNLSLEYTPGRSQVIFSLNLGLFEVFVIGLLLFKIQIFSECIKTCSELCGSLGISLSLFGCLLVLINKFFAKSLL